MARQIEPCSRTYGFPIYCAGWVPFSHISTSSASPEKESEGDDKEDPSSNADISDASDRLLVVLGGGGGEGRSGVPNALVVSGFDFSSRSLSEQPVQ
jgi:prolactin regulatory element-binding protein